MHFCRWWPVPRTCELISVTCLILLLSLSFWYWLWTFFWLLLLSWSLSFWYWLCTFFWLLLLSWSNAGFVLILLAAVAGDGGHGNDICPSRWTWQFGAWATSLRPRCPSIVQDTLACSIRTQPVKLSWCCTRTLPTRICCAHQRSTHAHARNKAVHVNSQRLTHGTAHPHSNTL